MISKKVKITKRSVETVPVPDSGYNVLHDTEIPGFHVRVLPSGKRTYHLNYRQHGKERRPKIGEHGPITSDQARSIAEQWRGKLAAGKDPRDEKSTASAVPTLHQLFSQHQTWSETRHKPRYREQNEYLFRTVLGPEFGQRQIDQISRSDVERMHTKFADTPTKANHALTLLKALLNKAQHWDLLPPGNNPCNRVRKFEEGRHERFLTPEEYQRLHATLDSCESSSTVPMAALNAIRLLMLTGCRRGEILGLTWGEVGLAHGELLLKDSKTGRKRVYLSDPAVELLRGLTRGANDQLVFSGTKSAKQLQTVEKVWQKVRSLAGLEDVRLHDLRHSFASAAISHGVPLNTVGKMLGHKDVQTTQRYAHLSEEHMRRAVEAIGEATKRKNTDFQ